MDIDPHRALLYVLIFLHLLLLLHYIQLWPHSGNAKPIRSTKPQVLKPKTDKDCPHCQAIKTLTPPASATQPIPWAQRKGRGGRKKIITTQHHFCPNPECDYYLNHNENLHVLVDYGSHGKTEPIQNFFCQACRHKFTSR